MDRECMKQVAEIFEKNNNFLITSHINPEGDSVGSQLAVYFLLKSLGKNAVIVNHDTVPDNMKFLTGADSITRNVPGNFNPAVIVVLDCPVKERIGGVHKHIREDNLVLNIDHHISNEFFGDINWVEPKASSVGEMIYFLIKMMGARIGEKTAKAVYTAIITDSGMFNYSNTSSDTHVAAAELIRLGISPKEIHSEIFERKGVSEIRMLARALNTLRMEADGRIAYMCLTREMYTEENVDFVSTDEFINFPRSIRGVEVAIFFKENITNGNKVNASFRSSGKVNVNALAGLFGGGGHAKAAGCVFDCSLEQAKDKVLKEAKKMIAEL